MNIKMIVSDLDDTLLHTDKTISDYTKSVLNRCRALGIKVVFATARSSQAAAKALVQYMPDVFIGYGGGLALEGSTVIHRSAIPADVSFSMINECLRDPDILNVHATNEAVALTDCLDYHDADSHYRLTDFTVPSGRSYLKISVIAANPDAVGRIGLRYPMCDMLRYSGEDLYRFANRDAVKWTAVKAVAEHYGIATCDIAAFGDDVNDIEMLRHAGTGVAMANAIAEAKAAADYICGTNDEDGVAKWLEENLL